MTKLESAEIIIKQEGNCREPEYIYCEDCCLDPETCCGGYFEGSLRQAKEYLKENEMKTEVKVGDIIQLTEDGKNGVYKNSKCNLILKEHGKAKIAEIVSYNERYIVVQIEEHPFSLLFFTDEIETVEFKVGDKVKWNGKKTYGPMPFEGNGTDLVKDEVLTIKAVSDDKSCMLEEKIGWYNMSWFDKIEEVTYEIGKKYVVTNYEKDLSNEQYCNEEDNHRILVAYIPNAKYPFICVSNGWAKKYANGGKYSTCGWRYAKAVEEPKYKAYSKPKLEWILEETKVIFREKEIKIYALLKDGVMLENFGFASFDYFLKNCTWLDGTPCGDKINE
jgi:hypothetical protein